MWFQKSRVDSGGSQWYDVRLCQTVRLYHGLLFARRSNNPYSLSPNPLEGRTLARNGIPWKSLMSMALRMAAHERRTDGGRKYRIWTRSKKRHGRKTYRRRIPERKLKWVGQVRYSYPEYFDFDPDADLTDVKTLIYIPHTVVDDDWVAATTGTLSSSHRSHNHWELTDLTPL